MKITIFRKIKKSCNTKTLWKQFREFWNFMRFDPITHLQYNIKKLEKHNKNNIFSINAFEKSLEESFERCVRCGFVVSMVLHEFGYSPSPLKIDATYKKNWKKLKKHDFYRIFVRAITLWKYFCSAKIKNSWKCIFTLPRAHQNLIFPEMFQVLALDVRPKWLFTFFGKSEIALPRTRQNIIFSKKFQ